MADVIFVRVLEVLDRYVRDVEKNGVKVPENHIRLSCEGGQLDLLDDTTIDCPVGWSGLARVTAYAKSVPLVTRDGRPYDKIFFSPYKLEAFSKGYKLPKISDLRP